MNHDSLVLTVKMVRGNECSKAKKLRDSHSRLDEAVLAHLLTFMIRARQRLLEIWMTVWHLQHHHAGDDILEVPLGWMFGAVVSDCDMISKIRARQSVRNRLSVLRYYLTDGRGVRVQAGSGRPKAVPRQPPTPPYPARSRISCRISSKWLSRR